MDIGAMITQVWNDISRFLVEIWRDLWNWISQVWNDMLDLFSVIFRSIMEYTEYTISENGIFVTFALLTVVVCLLVIIHCVRRTCRQLRRDLEKEKNDNDCLRRTCEQLHRDLEKEKNDNPLAIIAKEAARKGIKSWQ